MQNIYTTNGYIDRNDYLQSLANDFNVPLDQVSMLAYLLGPSEDFDGLLTSLEDMDY